MKALALLVFIPLQLLFVPLAIVGLALATYKQLLISKRLGVSQTGIDVMSGRWTMHVFGMRKDEATVRMASVLPSYSPLGMWMVLFPLWVYSRIAGESLIYPRQVAPGQEDIRDLVTARTRYFDAIIKRRMPEDRGGRREGVTLYLTEESVRRGLRDMKQHAAPGSIIVADVYGERLTAVAKSGAGKKTLELTDEAFGFSLPFERDHEARLRSFVESEGLQVGEMNFMGTRDKRGPFMVVAEIVT